MALGSFGDRIRPSSRSRSRSSSGRRSSTQQRRQRLQEQRQGRDGHLLPTGGIDFSGCTDDPDTGFCCVEVEETVSTVKRDPILECTHRDEEKCHYTYVTQFEPTAEEVCEENFEKICQITFKQEAKEETVDKCYRPLIKTCNGQGEEICQTVFESSCTTRYIEKQPGKFVGDTKCEKQPVDICGAGCTTEEGPEECHDKTVVSLLDIPEEVCDLNPQKTCKLQTRLVPKLKPEHECTIIPREVCNLKFTNPAVVDQPLKTKWCQDPAPPTPGETYEESAAQAPLVSSRIPRNRNDRPVGARPSVSSPPQPVQNVAFNQQFSKLNGFSQENQLAPTQQNVGLNQQQVSNQVQNQNAFTQQNVGLNQQQFSNQLNQNAFSQQNVALNHQQQFSTGSAQEALQEASNLISLGQENQGFDQQQQSNIQNVQDNAPFRDNFSNFEQGRNNQGNRQRVPVTSSTRQGRNQGNRQRVPVFSNGGNQQQFRRGRMVFHDEEEEVAVTNSELTIPASEKLEKKTVNKSEGGKSMATI